MKYMLLLRQDPSIAPGEDSPELAAEMEKWGALYGELAGAGVLITAMGLADEVDATTLRTRGGTRSLTDGPFAETKEHFFSFFVIDVPDLDAAAEWAAKMPNAAYGSVEIRPLSPHEQAQP